MILETIDTGGCRSYLIGCPRTLVGAVIDPETSQVDRYRALAARHGLTIRYVIDTHTHADHFSAARRCAQTFNAALVMGTHSPAPHVDLKLDDGAMLLVGDIRLKALHTPGHTRDSMSLVTDGHVFTGDALLIGGTGRTDLPTGDPDQLYDSLFGRLLLLDPATQVHPAHEYRGRAGTTIGEEIATNPRLQKTNRADFIAMMRTLDLKAPTHLTEALRVNISGARSVAETLAQATASVPFLSMEEVRDRLPARSNDFVVLDVREKDAFDGGHVPGAMLLPRGQLELRVNDVFPDPGVRIVCVCEFGKISTLAAATLREMGFLHAAALDGGMAAWRDSGLPLER